MASRGRSFEGGRACAALCIVVSLAGIRAQEAPAPPPPSPGRALELYDAGRYVEARQVLEQLAAQGPLDGPLQYRLYYCQNLERLPAAPQTLARAIEALEREQASAKNLEAAFYLVNAYSNSGRSADAGRVAQAATGRVESKQLPEPTDPLEQFRLGKLYADQQKGEQAERWYAASLKSLRPATGGTSPAYVLWAARYMADATFARGDYTEAEGYLARLTDQERPSPDDLDRLAVARARIGMFNEAGQAWRRIERIDPANADRARYSSRLAEAAAKLPGYSAAAPDGRLWTQLTEAELEAIMTEQAAVARKTHEEGADWKSLDPPKKAELQGRLDRARPVLVGAALEYTLQGHNIREAAFMGGFAPLIFHDKEWQLPKR